MWNESVTYLSGYAAKLCPYLSLCPPPPMTFLLGINLQFKADFCLRAHIGLWDVFFPNPFPLPVSHLWLENSNDQHRGRY